MKKRKGQASVLGIILIILQIMIAFAAIAGVIISVTKDSTDQITTTKFTTQLDIKEVKLWLVGGAMIKIARGSSEEDINALKIAFHEKNGASQNIIIYDPEEIPKPLETKTIILGSDIIPIANSAIDKISIYPMFGESHGLELKEPENSIQRDSSGQRILDPPQQAISWWRFDKTANDFIDNNHGTLYGDAAITEDGALRLDGEGDYVDIGHHDNLDIEDKDWTIGVWVKPERLTSSQYIVSKRGPGEFANGQYAAFLYENTFKAFLFDEYAKNVDGQTAINPNEWTYLTAAYRKGDSLKTYVNGEFDAQVSISGAVYDNLEQVPFQIGSAKGTQYFQGLIDDVLIVQEALSEDEIKEIYQNQKRD